MASCPCTDGGAFGRRAKSLPFIAFEDMIDRPLADVRREFGLGRDTPFAPVVEKVSEPVAQELIVQEKMRAA